MELFLVVLGLGLLVTLVLYTKKQPTSTVSIKPAITKEVDSQITDAVTLVEEAPKKRGRKPKITAAKKVVKGKKQVTPSTPRGRKKKS
jgi:hypothetical protein